MVSDKITNQIIILLHDNINTDLRNPLYNQVKSPLSQIFHMKPGQYSSDSNRQDNDVY